MAERQDDPRHNRNEDTDPAPWLGRVGDGATQPSGEYISRELRELSECARAQREQHERKARERERERGRK